MRVSVPEQRIDFQEVVDTFDGLDGITGRDCGPLLDYLLSRLVAWQLAQVIVSNRLPRKVFLALVAHVLKGANLGAVWNVQLILKTLHFVLVAADHGRVLAADQPWNTLHIAIVFGQDRGSHIDLVSYKQIGLGMDLRFVALQAERDTIVIDLALQ